MIPLVFIVSLLFEQKIGGKVLELRHCIFLVFATLKPLIVKIAARNFARGYSIGERIQFFVLRASTLGLISSMRLDSKKDIQSVKSAWSVLRSQLKPQILLPL